MKRTIYLDFNATSPLRPEVLDAMMPYLTAEYGNPSSIHSAGELPRNAIVAARKQVARLLGCRPAEVVFNGCGTEGINTAIRGVLEATPERRHIVTTAVEHHASLHSLEFVARRGVDVTTLGVDAKGRLPWTWAS